jgi:hypothetical protein
MEVEYNFLTHFFDIPFLNTEYIPVLLRGEKVPDK